MVCGCSESGVGARGDERALDEVKLVDGPGGSGDGVRYVMFGGVVTVDSICQSVSQSVSQWDLGIKDGQPGQRPCSSASPSWDAREAKPLRLTKRRRFAGLQGIPSRMNTVALFSVLRRRSAMRTMAMDSSVVQFLTSPHCLMYFLYILGLKENIRIDDPRRREQGQREGKLTMHQNRTHLS
jgi:hypothetical protein